MIVPSAHPDKVKGQSDMALQPLGDVVQPGTRVQIVKDPDWDGPWPLEPTGFIDPDADCPIRVIDLATKPEINVPDSDRRPMREFLVHFDEPQRDDEGAGPYASAVIWEKYLRLIE